MDYAKLALLKAEELEKKGRVGANSGISRSGLIFEKNLSPNEEIKICSVRGKGEIGLIVSLALASSGSSGQISGEISFMLGGKKVFSRPVSEAPLFMASVQLDGTSKISIKPTVAVTLVSADVMVIGGEVVNSAAYGVRVAECNGITAAVYTNDGEIRVSVSGSGELPNLTKYSIVGFGESAAITSLKANDGDGFAVVHIDTQTNMFLSIIGLSGEIKSCDMLNIKADNAAIIGLGGFQLAIGYCYGGYAYAAGISYPETNIDYSIRLEEAVSIEFIRDCRPPAVILNKKSGNVIRMAQEEISGDEAISVLVQCSRE